MEDGLMGWFEFFVVTTCFFSKAYGRNIDLWKAIQSPMEAEDLVKIAVRSFGWISILCIYLIFRVQFLTFPFRCHKSARLFGDMGRLEGALLPLGRYAFL